MERVYTIDGARFNTLDDFYHEITSVLIPNAQWGRTLDAFDDIFAGGFGTPDNGFVICWQNASLSRERLGHEETACQLERMLEHCHRDNREQVLRRLNAARERQGETVFDWIVAIIQSHAKDGVRLDLHDYASPPMRSSQ